MSGVAGSSANSSPSSASGVGDALLKLAAFVQTPEYVTRVAELTELETRATAKHEAVTAAETNLARAQQDHTAAVAKFTEESAAFDSYQRDMHETLAARETDAARRETALTARERAHARAVADDTADLTARHAALDTRSANLDQREKELAAAKADIDRQSADLARRIARMREAAQ